MATAKSDSGNILRLNGNIPVFLNPFMANPFFADASYASVQNNGKMEAVILEGALRDIHICSEALRAAFMGPNTLTSRG